LQGRAARTVVERQRVAMVAVKRVAARVARATGVNPLVELGVKMEVVATRLAAEERLAGWATEMGVVAGIGKLMEEEVAEVLATGAEDLEVLDATVLAAAVDQAIMITTSRMMVN